MEGVGHIGFLVFVIKNLSFNVELDYCVPSFYAFFKIKSIRSACSFLGSNIVLTSQLEQKLPRLKNWVLILHTIVNKVDNYPVNWWNQQIMRKGSKSLFKILKYYIPRYSSKEVKYL